MPLTPGRFVGQALDLRATSSQRGFVSRTAAAIGGTGWTPNHLSPMAWYDASNTATITSSGGAASQWDDLGPRKLHLTQATGANQPATGSRTVNGLNVLNFNGTTHFMQAATASDWRLLNDGTPHLVAAAVQPDVATGQRYIFSTANNASGPGSQLRANAAAWSHLYRTSVACSNDGGTVTAAATTIVTLIARFAVSGAAERSRMYVNDGAVIANNAGTTAPSTADPNTPLTVGNYAVVTGYWDGAIGELIIVAGVDATEINRRQLLLYLARKWGVTL